MSRPTLEQIREDEMRHRRRGFFVAAESARRLGDHLELTGEWPRAYSYFDRGAMLPFEGFLRDGFAFIPIDTGIAFVLTPDKAALLAQAALRWVDPGLADEIWGADFYENPPAQECVQEIQPAARTEAEGLRIVIANCGFPGLWCPFCRPLRERLAALGEAP